MMQGPGWVKARSRCAIADLIAEYTTYPGQSSLATMAARRVNTAPT